jgi:hypothetical protein
MTRDSYTEQRVRISWAELQTQLIDQACDQANSAGPAGMENTTIQG